MNKNDCLIRRETPADYRECETLIREAFWNVYRPGCTEHFVLHQFRNRPEFIQELDLVLEKSGCLIGQVIFVKTELYLDDGKTLPILTFGPIGIAPAFQRQGYGKQLLDFALNEAALMGFGAVCMEGNLDFYQHCGFRPAFLFGVRYGELPLEARVPFFLARELRPDFLKNLRGTYHTPEGYFVNDNDAEIFDAEFPPKVKLKLPSQLFD